MIGDWGLGIGDWGLANVLKFISENVDDSVRDLEGIINSLMAYSVNYIYYIRIII